ncbi:hypothetical protein DCAR_0522570 [Daucus carota subsp. sativus]|uniref:Uncharacterized protein n=1 Tax=Daucus carota subsp. sativus TaxID=79200 RepID=A0AAF0X7G5_DAUCS|nr:hypothetical protein DCAR_0522570 [Daucus carota subsp. sativus]
MNFVFLMSPKCLMECLNEFFLAYGGEICWNEFCG